MGLVVHDFEEDLEFGEFAFVLQEKVLVFLGQIIQPDLTSVKRKLISLQLDESSREGKANRTANCMFKNLRSRKSILLFYAIEFVVTAALFLWLYNLTTSTGNLKFTVNTGSVAELATFVALGTLAWILGLSHGLDADHLAAIDNTTRKLMQEKKPSTFTGTFFSLGHSGAVFIFAFGLILAAKYLTSFVPALSIIGSLVSAIFLFIIAILNVQIVFHLWGVFKRMENKQCSDTEVAFCL